MIYRRGQKHEITALLRLQEIPKFAIHELKQQTTYPQQIMKMSSLIGCDNLIYFIPHSRAFSNLLGMYLTCQICFQLPVFLPRDAL